MSEGGDKFVFVYVCVFLVLMSGRDHTESRIAVWFLPFIPALQIIASLFLLNDNNVFMYSENLWRAEQSPPKLAFNHSRKMVG